MSLPKELEDTRTFIEIVFSQDREKVTNGETLEIPSANEFLIGLPRYQMREGEAYALARIKDYQYWTWDEF